MPISREDVAHLARLAHLGLEPEEVDGLVGDLAAILAYVERLSPEPVTDESQGIDETPLREDVPGPPMETGRAVEGAPERTNGLFKVPPAFGGV